MRGKQRQVCRANLSRVDKYGHPGLWTRHERDPWPVSRGKSWQKSHEECRSGTYPIMAELFGAYEDVVDET